jgi:outer membrane protein OmpA-like peptidoglycan-associated protein
MTVNYTLSLHGVTIEREAEIAVTLLDDNTVSVTSNAPISLSTADFNLDAGVAKLEDAAKVRIIPSATVTFDFMFLRAQSPDSYQIAAATMEAAAGIDYSVTKEDTQLSLAACTERLEIMSATGHVDFASGSAALDPDSKPVLSNIADIIKHCPELSISVDGHTDADGDPAQNQALSEARANSVRAFLVEAGADGDRITAVGYGETLPVAASDIAENRKQNRRIEFSVVQDFLGQ